MIKKWIIDKAKRIIKEQEEKDLCIRARICPKCGHKLIFSHRLYPNIQQSKCSNCDFYY